MAKIGRYFWVFFLMFCVSGWKAEMAYAQELPPVYPFYYDVTNDGVVIRAYMGNNAHVIIPSTIERIGYTGNIESLPVTSINGGSGWGAVESITFPENCRVEEEAFSERSNLKSIYFKGSVSLSKKAFSGCKNLTNISFSDKGTVTIGDGVFDNCTALTSIDLPDNTHFDRVSPFFGCSKLSSVKLPNKQPDILPHAAFIRCTNLKTITIPDGWTKLDTILYESCIETIELPESISGSCIDAFAWCEKLKKVKIPDGVTNLDGAFLSCKSLESIDIPDSVTSLAATFSQCESLKNIEIPDGVTNLDGTFWACESLKRIEIPNSVTNIGSRAFCGCISLESIEIPNSVTNIGEYAFSGCKNLKKLTIFNNNCKIKNEDSTIFKTAVIYGYSGSTAEKYAKKFKRKFIALDEKNDGKDSKRFTDKKTKAKYIKKSGTEVAYAGTTDKKSVSVVIPATVKFDGKTYKVTSVYAKAFANNKIISSVTIGKNVSAIEDKAFYKCTSLTKITIPSKVNKIGMQTFCGCKKLKSITIKTKKLTKKNVGNKAFYGIHKSAKIKVPKDKYKAYKKLLKEKGIGSKVKIIK